LSGSLPCRIESPAQNTATIGKTLIDPASTARDDPTIRLGLMTAAGVAEELGRELAASCRSKGSCHVLRDSRD
jgi:hypothetical protein